MVRKIKNSIDNISNAENTKLSNAETFLETIRIICYLIGKIFPWGSACFIAKELAGKATTLNSDFLGKYADLDFENIFKKTYLYFILFLLIIILGLLIYIFVLHKENKDLNRNNTNLKQMINEIHKKGDKKWIQEHY